MTTQQRTDSRDEQIVASRMAKLDTQPGPRVGDFVRFNDGHHRRISCHWTDDSGWDGGCQTSDGGSFYLGDYGVSFSGGLYPSLPTESLIDTSETRHGSVWIFHHDYHTAHNGVTFSVPFRVFAFDGVANR